MKITYQYDVREKTITRSVSYPLGLTDKTFSEALDLAEWTRKQKNPRITIEE